MRSVTRIQPRSFYFGVYCDVSSWGGGLTSARSLAEALQQAGHSTLVLGVNSESGKPEGPPKPQAEALNVPLRVPRRLWRFKQWLVPGALARALADLPPPQMAFVAVSPFWILAAKRAWPEVPVYFLYPCLLANCLPFGWPQRRAPNLWARVHFQAICRLERRAFQLADATFVPTDAAFEELRAYSPRLAGRLKRVSYGVRRVQVAQKERARTRQANGVTSDEFLIVASGTCDRNKGFELAIRALVSTPRHLHLAIIGDGPERDNLARLARELGLAKRVHLPGVQRSVTPWYAAADCVVSTSFYESLGYTLLEGMAAGRPVLVPEHDPPRVYSGLAKPVRHVGSGRCYVRDAGRLGEELNALARDPEACAIMGERGRDYVAEHCTWDECLAFLTGSTAARAAEASSRPNSHLGRGHGRYISEAAPKRVASANSLRR